MDLNKIFESLHEQIFMINQRILKYPDIATVHPATRDALCRNMESCGKRFASNVKLEIMGLELRIDPKIEVGKIECSISFEKLLEQ